MSSLNKSLGLRSVSSKRIAVKKAFGVILKEILTLYVRIWKNYGLSCTSFSYCTFMMWWPLRGKIMILVSSVAFIVTTHASFGGVTVTLPLLAWDAVSEPPWDDKESTSSCRRSDRARAPVSWYWRFGSFSVSAVRVHSRLLEKKADFDVACWICD